MKIRFIAFILLFSSTQIMGTPSDWYTNLIFKDPSFTYEFTRTLGYTFSGGADIGECITAARKIQDKNIDQWYQQWFEVGNRLHRLGDLWSQENNLTSSQGSYFRASNYYRTASFYMDAPNQRPLGINAWKQSRIAFLKAITHIPYIRTVRIPYEKTTLPGYFISTKAQNAPLLIVNTGFDGTAEELYFATGLAAHRRGYNVLLIEGPGQGELIKIQNLPFRYDWEKVITPVIDFTNKLPNVNHQKIALMGLSMGGYLTARAAAFEPRIKALILNGGVYDMSTSVTNTLPQQMVDFLKKNPDIFNNMMTKAMTEDINAKWFFNNGMWVFNVKTPAEVVNTLKQYTLANVIDKIQCPTLVIDSTSDKFFQNQPQLVYSLLRSPKTLLVFTAEEAAQAHCQVGANAISNERVLNWLDLTFDWHPHMIN